MIDLYSMGETHYFPKLQELCTDYISFREREVNLVLDRTELQQAFTQESLFEFRMAIQRSFEANLALITHHTSSGK